MKDIRLQRDIGSCLAVIANEFDNSLYTNKVYRNTNEALVTILREEQIKNKKVLSVMASTDQVFSAHYLGAKSVDTFDVNILAYYYFFLKKWSYMLTGKYYIPADNDILRKCLKMHNNTIEEKRAYIFWNEILNVINRPLYYSGLFFTSSCNYNVPYQNDSDFEVDRIKPNFNHFNLFKDIPDIGTYDVIILSNILEYMYNEDNEIKYYEILLKVIENLNKLLKPGGIAISSNILDYNYSENALINKNFIYEEGPTGYSINLGRDIPLCYTLRKRKK